MGSNNTGPLTLNGSSTSTSFMSLTHLEWQQHQHQLWLLAAVGHLGGSNGALQNLYREGEGRGRGKRAAARGPVGHLGRSNGVLRNLYIGRGRGGEGVTNKSARSRTMYVGADRVAPGSGNEPRGLAACCKAFPPPPTP